MASLRWSLSSLSEVEGWHAPAGRRTCDTPASCPGQADQTGRAGGCLKTWGPAGRSFCRTTRAASADSEARPGPSAPDPTPAPAQNRGSRAGSRKAGPEAGKQDQKHYPHPPCRIFICVGFMAGSVVCVQIARLWRAGGLACLRFVPCEHFPQEDPSGSAGRPGSSPPAPGTHSAGADHPACRNPQAEHRCSGTWTSRLPPARLLPAPGSTSAISRRSPAATSAPGCRRCSARWSCVGTRARTGRPGQGVARPPGGPPDLARPPQRRSPAQARSQEHSSASPASSPATL